MIPRAREPRPIVNSGGAGLLRRRRGRRRWKRSRTRGERGPRRTGAERVTEGIFLGQDFLTVLTSTMKHSVRFFFFPSFSLFFSFSRGCRSIDQCCKHGFLSSVPRITPAILCLRLYLARSSSERLRNTYVHLKQKQMKSNESINIRGNFARCFPSRESSPRARSLFGEDCEVR